VQLAWCRPRVGRRASVGKPDAGLWPRELRSAAKRREAEYKLKGNKGYVRFEVFASVTVKNGVFVRDSGECRSFARTASRDSAEFPRPDSCAAGRAPGRDAAVT
jgi:hypothetical protein